MIDDGFTYVGSGTLSGAPPEVARRTPFHGVNEAFERSQQVFERVIALPDRLAGVEGPSNAKADAPLPPGLLNALMSSSGAIVSHAGAAHKALDRIERMLP